MTKRHTKDDDWGAPENLGSTVISAADEMGPAISYDGLELYFCGYSSFRPGGFGNADLWVSTRSDVSEMWGPPVNLGPTVNSPNNDRYPSISADGLVLFFNSGRPGIHGRQDIWMTRRVTRGNEWGVPVNLGPVINKSDLDGGPCISVDGRTLYFHSVRPGGYSDDRYDLWQAPIESIVDFTGDGKVDGRDVLVVADRWGTSDSLCDIGLMPWGDGIVDLQDLIVLAKHIGREVVDATLIAHWALDETEGTVAHDSAGDNSFTVIDIPSYTSTTIPGPGGVGASGVAVHPNGTRVYVTNPEWWLGGQGSTVWVIDRVTNAVLDEITCGKGSCGIALHPDGKTVYVTNAFDGTVTVFDTTTHAVLDTIVLETVGADEPCFPVPLAIHPEGTFVYAANRQGPTFWAINTATHAVLTRPFGHTHVCIGVHPDGTAVYLPDFDDRDSSLPPQGKTVDVIDTKTLDLITTIDGMNAPLGVTVHPDRTRLYIVNQESDAVSVVDAVTYAHIADITVGTKPEAYGQFIGPAVAIGDAIMAEANPDDIGEAQEMLDQGDALVHEAAVWQNVDKRRDLLANAVKNYEDAWAAAVASVQ